MHEHASIVPSLFNTLFSLFLCLNTHRCRALYDFDPEFDLDTPSGDELTFYLDDQVIVLEKPVGRDWWFAQIDDQFGWVPKNHIEKTENYYE